MPKLLSICIPTYERNDLFDLCLSSIEDNLKELCDPEDIEVIISINDVGKEKKILIEKYILLNTVSKVYQNKGNIGGDKNIINCYLKAVGKYIWVIGDDDFMIKGSLSYLVNKIKDNSFSSVYVNSYGYDESIDEKPISTNKSEVLNYNSFFSKIAYRGTFISSVIIKKELIDFNQAEKYISSSLYQLVLIIQASKNDNNLYMDRYHIAAKINRNYDYDFYSVFVKNYINIIKDNFDVKTYNKIIRKTILLFYSQYFFYNKLNNRSTDNLDMFQDNLCEFRLFRMINIINLLPKPFSLIYGILIIIISRLIYGDLLLLVSKSLIRLKKIFIHKKQ